MTEAISPYAYQLKLPDNVRIHNVFHILLLDLAGSDPLPGQKIPPPPPIEIDGEDEYYIEEILDSQIRRHKLQYLVKWTGYDEPSWEPADNLSQAEAVDIFHQRYPSKPSLAGARS